MLLEKSPFLNYPFILFYRLSYRTRYKMEENSNYMDELIVSFLSGELNRKGRDELKEWIDESEEHRRYFLQRQELWFSALWEEERSHYDHEAAFRQFQQRVAASKSDQKKTFGYFESVWFRYAAVVALVGMIAYFSYRQGEGNLREALADIEVLAPLGSQAQMRLPDGTLVTLNAGSRLTYAQDFGVDNREVELQGEGYFEVAHNEEIPFYVRSKNLQVKVLGTKFNFQDYPEERQVIVSLLEGKVVLHNQIRHEADRCLRPDERVVLDKSDGIMKIESIKRIKADIDWKQGVLSFDEVLLPEVVQTLERSYNVRITLQTDSLADYRFYGTFNCTSQSIKDVLEALEATGKIHYALKDNHVVLY